MADVQDLLPTNTSSDGALDHEAAAAWLDSDDERLVISLASNSRLRKLRTTEAEDLVNGKEYTKRLRRQFERLYPAPEWANPIADREINRNKTRTSQTPNSSDYDSGDDFSTGLDELSSKPLAKLLQNASGFTRLPSKTSGSKKTQHRPELIDVHRLKDVGGAQPVSLLLFPSVSMLAKGLDSQPSLPSHSTLRTLFFLLLARLHSFPFTTFFLTHHIPTHSLQTSTSGLHPLLPPFFSHPTT